MKKILTILLMSLMLVACDEGQTYVEEEVEYIGNTLVESRQDENVAIFKRETGEI